jgi:hypothetical protein
MIFHAMSWGGVAFLILAHICISLGVAKALASRISALGAGLSLVAAGGMGIWPVFALNVVWMAISLWGSRIPERIKPSKHMDIGLIALSLVAILAWFQGAQLVAWTASSVYVLGWLAFSVGAVTRMSYLGACLIAGICTVPALWALGAHAFAVNESFGAFMSLVGIYKEVLIKKKPTPFDDIELPEIPTLENTSETIEPQKVDA